MKMNIGLLGCSRICVSSIINIIDQIENINLYGCAASTLDRARDFSSKHGIPHFFKSYQELLECPQIDIVYISLANSLHYKWTIEAIKHKKNILVEKPVCLSLEEALNIKKQILKNSVFLLEGVMVQHHEWQKTVKEIIDSEKYGKLRSITTELHFIPKYNFEGNYRSSSQMGGGCFWDLGSYWAQFIQYILSFDIKSYTAYSDFDGPNNCDWNFRADILHKNGVKIHLSTSFEKPYQIEHILKFDTGKLVIEDFFKCRFHNVEFIIKEYDFSKDICNEILFSPQNFYINQLQFFSNALQGNISNIDFNDSIERIELMEKIYSLALNKM